MLANHRVQLAWAAIAVFSASAPCLRAEPARLTPSQTRTLQQICGNCHARPGIDVPQLGDEPAWQPRRSKGLDALVANTVNGFGQMPPLGTCSWCSEADLRALVALMAGLPAEPAP